MVLTHKGATREMQRAPSRRRRSSHALLALLVVAGVRGGEALFGGGARQAMALPAWHPARFRQAPVELQREEEAKDAGAEVGTVGTAAVVAARPPEVATAQTNAVDAPPNVAPVRDHHPTCDRRGAVVAKTRQDLCRGASRTARNEDDLLPPCTNGSSISVRGRPRQSSPPHRSTTADTPGG